MRLIKFELKMPHENRKLVSAGLKTGQRSCHHLGAMKTDVAYLVCSHLMDITMKSAKKGVLVITLVNNLLILEHTEAVLLS